MDDRTFLDLTRPSIDITEGESSFRTVVNGLIIVEAVKSGSGRALLGRCEKPGNFQVKNASYGRALLE